MRIAVVGAGAIGGFYGGLLARAGHDVSFLARGEHLGAINARGLEVQSAQFGTLTVRARASDKAGDLGRSDLVLFAVKTYDLEPAGLVARDLLARHGSVVTFQNGVDAPDRLAEILDNDRVLIGTTGLESTILSPGVIGHLSKSHYVYIGSLHGPPTPRVQSAVETMRGADINATAVEDGHRALWEKACVLVPMATITSVCRAPIGAIRDLPETRRLIDQLLDEVPEVGRAYGYDLAEARQQAAGIVEAWSYDGKASMARDFERGNRTELEAITGAIVRLAEAKSIDVPVSRIGYALLKLREQVGAGAGGEKPVGAAADRR